jgi:hypothetical protein
MKTFKYVLPIKNYISFLIPLQNEIKHRWYSYLTMTSLLLTSVSSLEENRPAIFLSPRNFNPHPYEANYDLRDATDANRVGPVVFPPSPPDEDDSVNSNVLTIERERVFTHPIDNHPYARVARKRKYKLPGRFIHQVIRNFSFVRINILQ